MRKVVTAFKLTSPQLILISCLVFNRKKIYCQFANARKALDLIILIHYKTK